MRERGKVEEFGDFRASIQFGSVPVGTGRRAAAQDIAADRGSEWIRRPSTSSAAARCQERETWSRGESQSGIGQTSRRPRVQENESLPGTNTGAVFMPASRSTGEFGQSELLPLLSCLRFLVVTKHRGVEDFFFPVAYPSPSLFVYFHLVRLLFFL